MYVCVSVCMWWMRVSVCGVCVHNVRVRFNTNAMWLVPQLHYPKYKSLSHWDALNYIVVK